MSSSRDLRVIWRARLVAAVLLLAALAFRQAPGAVVPDTKLDLTANPAGFLARALHMWDPQGAFGQLQNQAYGYLFPVGPFHLVLDALGVPDWITQRLFWSVILGVAFLGFWRLSNALGIGSPWARYLGAFFFALSPRMLSEVAVTSVEVWPYAVAPWVLLPLVDPVPRSWAWRISRSALAFVFVGGVNAVATGATLVLPTLWFLTREGARRSWRPFGMWLASVAAVSVWWAVPLVLLGRYSPPFLDWIENAPITTGFASPFHALTGTTTWLSFLSGVAGPAWPAGWDYVTTPLFVLLTVAVAGLGLLGLASRRVAERSFLLLSLITGLFLVTLGHTGGVSSPIGAVVQDLLDGPLAALRNTHKFELVVRIPLVLGLVHALDLLSARVRQVGLAHWVVPVMAGSLLAAVASPGIVARLPRPEGYTQIPQHWHDTANWLDRQPGTGTVLVLPAASFADFTWGSTKDEPLQALMARPFAVRDAVPLGSAGATRFLDAVEQRLSTGAGGEDVREALTRAGVRYLVMRNDLRATATGNVGALVHEALAESGLTEPVAAFGPRTVNPSEGPDRTVDARTRLPYPSVEVFDVGPVERASVIPQTSVVRVAGGPEDVIRVAHEVPTAGAVITGSDGVEPVDSPGQPLVLTDGNQRREVFFGRSTNNRSEVLTPDDAGRTGRAVNDYVSDATAGQSVRVWDDDLAEVTASSSASDADATLRISPANSPAAAVDGRPETAWVSGRFGRAQGEWLQLRFKETRSVEGSVIRFPARTRAQAKPAELLVETDTGRVRSVVPAGADTHRLRVPPGTTTRLRVTVSRASGDANASGVAIAEVEVPGTGLGSFLRLPETPRVPDVVMLGRSSPATPDCVRVGERPLCTPDLRREGEEEFGFRRAVPMSDSSFFAFSGAVTAVPGGAERLIERLTPITVTASSRAAQSAAARPAAAVDGDLGTGWVAAPGDARPLLGLTLPQRVRTGALQLLTDQYLAGARPERVALSFDGGPETTRNVDSEGFVRWPVDAFRKLTIRFLDWSEVRSVDSATGFSEALPVGVSEVALTGVANPRVPTDLATGAPCGFGPELVVGGTRVATSVEGTVGDVLRGDALQWTACDLEDGFLRVPSGEVRVTAEASAEFSPLSLTLTRDGARAPVPDQEPTPEVLSTSATAMTVSVARRSVPALLVLPQNHNSGWTATSTTGEAMTPVRVNGWQQGWVIPAGERLTVEASFTPGAAYRVALMAGALLSLLCAAAVWRTRRAPGRSPLLPPAELEPAVAILGVTAILVLVAGVTGGIACGLAFLVLLASSRRRESVPTFIAVCLAFSAVWVATHAWPDARVGVDSVAVQGLVLAATAAACLSGAAGGPLRRSPRRARRIKGRSSA